MTFAELVAAALAHLERAAIPYMVVEALGLREVWRRVGG